MSFISARIISVIRPDTVDGVAFAGANQSVLCAAIVTLDGQIIPGPVEEHTFEWEQTSGTPVTLLNPTTLTPSFVNPQISDIEFTFFVDRNTPFEDSDIVIISRRPESRPTNFGGSISAQGPGGIAQILSEGHSGKNLTNDGAFANTLMHPKFEKVFAKYPLSDEFAYSIDFTSLYTELAGVLSIWIEEHELQ